MRDRIKTALTREVTMPPWAIAVDFFWRVLVLTGAVLVAVLWWQAATRDEEADRNARIQACTTEYAATAAAWDAQETLLSERAEGFDRRGEGLFADIILQAAADTDLDPAVLRSYQQATDRAEVWTERAKAAALKVDRMAGLQIGLARFARLSVLDGNEFQCPPLPGRLTVEPIEVR